MAFSSPFDAAVTKTMLPGTDGLTVKEYVASVSRHWRDSTFFQLWLNWQICLNSTCLAIVWPGLLKETGNCRQRVWGNLLDNAIKYGRRGGGARSVPIRMGIVCRSISAIMASVFPRTR